MLNIERDVLTRGLEIYTRSGFEDDFEVAIPGDLKVPAFCRQIPVLWLHSGREVPPTRYDGDSRHL